MVASFLWDCVIYNFISPVLDGDGIFCTNFLFFSHLGQISILNFLAVLPKKKKEDEEEEN